MKTHQLDTSSLRIVILECPYENWENPLVPNLFKDLIQLKHDGYKGFYNYGFLPVDASDFAGTHHLICQETATTLTPIAGFRSITLNQCDNYRLLFPSLCMTEKQPETKQHLHTVQGIILKSLEENKTLSFGSSWTIHPNHRNNREDVELLKDISRGMLAAYQTENQIDEEMCLGLIKVKTDLFFSELGYQPITFNNETLPPFGYVGLDYRLGTLLHRTKFTQMALEAQKRYETLWKNRIYISHIEQNRNKKIAA